MRILLVNDYGFRNGGAETAILRLRDGLRARGDEVRIFTADAGFEANRDFADFTCRGTVSPFRTLLQSANPWARPALAKAVRNFRPDVVHLNLFLTQLSPLILPALRGIPCLYNAHWARAVCPTGTLMLRDGRACRRAWGAACYLENCLPLRDWVPLMAQMKMLECWRGAIRRTVACSETLAIRLRERGWGNVEAISFGVDRYPDRSALYDPPTVLFAGRLVREKGAAILLRAFSQVLRSLPAARLDIAGSGPEEPELRRLAGEMGISARTVFHGWLTPVERDRLYSRAWAVAVPSVWEEPQGLVAMEAAAAGVAGVVSDAGGLAETVIHGETGVRVPSGDAGALAHALLGLLASRERANSMGAAAQIYARERFPADLATGRFRQIYRELLNDPG